MIRCATSRRKPAGGGNSSASSSRNRSRPSHSNRAASAEPGGQWRTEAFASGEALSFRQDPPLLLPRDDHGARLRDFTVAGDVPRVRFDRWNAGTGEGQFAVETFLFCPDAAPQQARCILSPVIVSVP